MANNNVPIIKRSRQAIWALVDLIEIYYQSPVRCPLGLATILSVSKDDNTVTVTTKKGVIKTFPARNCKIMVRPLTQLQGRNLNVIANLAMGIDSFTYSVKRSGYKIACIGKAYTVEFVIKPQFGIRIFDATGLAVEARNLGYIMAYLVERSYDLFNILRTPYAQIISGVAKQ